MNQEKKDHTYCIVGCKCKNGKGVNVNSIVKENSVSL